MSIIHDAWRFDCEDFGSCMSSYVSSDGLIDFNSLKKDALNDLKLNSVVRFFREYGGWQASAVIGNINAHQSDSDVIESCVVTLLYSSLARLNEGRNSMGLGGLWRRCLAVMSEAGWSELNANEAVFGKPFSALAPRHLLTKQLKGGRILFDSLRPLSVSGKAGWLGREDVNAIILKMSGVTHASDANAGCERTVWEAHKEVKAFSDMVNNASDANNGLCVIVSGERLAACWCARRNLDVLTGAARSAAPTGRRDCR